MQVRKRACGFFTIASSTEETVKAGKRVITIPSKCTEAHVPAATVWPVPYACAQPYSPGQWQPWTVVSPLLGLISLA